MHRVLATLANVDQLFERTVSPYPYTDPATGYPAVAEIPTWKCRGCDFSSLQGIQGLPFPHECQSLLTATPSLSQMVTG